MRWILLPPANMSPGQEGSKKANANGAFLAIIRTMLWQLAPLWRTSFWQIISYTNTEPLSLAALVILGWICGTFFSAEVEKNMLETFSHYFFNILMISLERMKFQCFEIQRIPFLESEWEPNSQGRHPDSRSPSLWFFSKSLLSLLFHRTEALSLVKMCAVSNQLLQLLQAFIS